MNVATDKIFLLVYLFLFLFSGVRLALRRKDKEVILNVGQKRSLSVKRNYIVTTEGGVSPRMEKKLYESRDRDRKGKHLVWVAVSRMSQQGHITGGSWACNARECVPNGAK